MKIFATNDITTVRLCQFYLGITPLEYQLDLSKLKFFRRIKYGKAGDEIGINHIFGHVGTEEQHLISKYGLDKNYSYYSAVEKVHSYFVNALRNEGLIV